MVGFWGSDLSVHLKSYIRVQQASKVPGETVRIHRSLVRDGVFNPENFQALIDRKGTTAANATMLLERLTSASTTGDFGPRFVPCEAVHPWIDSCVQVPVDRFVTVFRWMVPIYGALNLVPAILFKRAAFMEKPWKVIMRAFWGTMRSSAFLGVFVTFYQSASV